MAEYIEREAALEILEKSLTFCETVLDIGEYRDGCIAATQDDIGNIRHIPTADVVPKSEADDWIVTTKENLIRIEELENALKQAKAEATREIFAEIEKCMEHDYISSIGVYNGALELRIAELKKKRTEDQT